MSYNRRSLAPDSPFALAAAMLLLVSGAVRIAYYIITGFPMGSLWDMIVYVFLPVACCVVMAIMLLSRKNSLMPTIVPMLFGAAFFALKSFDFADDWIFGKTVHTVFCICLYAVFALIYILTVSGVLNTRAVLMLVCGLPLLFHVFVEDIFVTPPADFISFLPELSVILIMAGLFAEAWGMRRGRLY